MRDLASGTKPRHTMQSTMTLASLTIWTAVRTLHLLAGAIWVGGQIAIGAVIVPVLRTRADTETRSSLASAFGRRFAGISGAIVIPVLVASGIALLWHHGVQMHMLKSDEWQGLITAKSAFFALSLALVAAHGIASAAGHRSASRLLATGGLMVSIVVVILAAALVT